MSQKLLRFTWTIENLTAWDFDRRIESPRFVVRELGNVAFCLALEERGASKHGYCSLFLYRKTLGDTPEEVKVLFSIKVGETSRDTNDASLDIEEGKGWSNYIANHLILQNDAWSLLSGEIQIECTIHKPEIRVNPPPERVSDDSRRCVDCSARTRFKTKTASVKWNVRNFGALRNGETETIEVFLPSENSPRFLVTLLLTDRRYELGTVEMIVKNLRKLEADPTFVACRVSFGEKEDNRIVVVSTHAFDSENTCSTWKLPVYIRKQRIVKRMKIPQENMLIILLDFKVEEGVEFSEIDKGDCESEPCAKRPNCRKTSNTQGLSKTRQNLLALLREQKLCDVRLETPTKTIGAHKNILCSSSPIFAGMFEHPTLEKRTSAIQVTVVSAETLERFLECLYTEALCDEMDVEKATGLYVAADYYQVDFLKSTCSRFLTSNLQVENVCDVLALADRHRDVDLMDSVRDFVRWFKTRVLDSEEWKKLSAERPQLAIEISQGLKSGVFHDV